MSRKCLSGLSLREQTAPATPAAGFLELYAKGDHGLYVKDSIGVETNLLSDTLKVDKATLDANTILYAVTNDVPAALAVGPSTFVGRKAAGNIVAMTINEAKVILQDPFVYNVLIEGVANDGSNITTALTTLQTTAQAAAVAAGPRARVVLYFPGGTYGLSAGFAFKDRISVKMAPGATLRNLSTTGDLGFIVLRGSDVSFSGGTVDGMRSSQSSVQPTGAITVVKPVGLTGGSQTVAGGLLLTTAPSVGATSIIVSTITMGTGNDTAKVLPNDAIAISNGTDTEVVRVARTYDGVSLTIPLTSPLLRAYTTAAYVTVYSTDVDIHNTQVFSIGFQGIELWHVYDSTVHHTTIYDFIDTGIAYDNAGSHGCSIHHNVIEGFGRYGVGVDTGDVPITSGLVSDNDISYNVIRILNGGSDPSGSAVAGIFLGSGGPIARVSCIGNLIDISRDGDAGIVLQAQWPVDCPISDNIIYGGGRASTIGIQHVGQGDTTDISLNLTNNTIVGVDTCIDVSNAVTVAIRGGTLAPNAAGVGITIAPNNSIQQRIVIDGTRIRGGWVSINSIAPAPTLSPVIIITRATVITGAGSGIEVNVDAAWVVQRDDDLPREFSGSGIPSSTTIKTRALVGDRYTNKTGGAGTYLYRCTVAGSPGTWVATAA